RVVTFTFGFLGLNGFTSSLSDLNFQDSVRRDDNAPSFDHINVSSVLKDFLPDLPPGRFNGGCVLLGMSCFIERYLSFIVLGNVKNFGWVFSQNSDSECPRHGEELLILRHVICGKCTSNA